MGFKLNNKTVFIKSKGTQYKNKYFLERSSTSEVDKHYKNYFRGINNLQLKSTHFENDKNNITFLEEVQLEAENYATKSGQRLIFALNAFNQYSSIPKRYRGRISPFQISRGFYDYDEITIDLPKGFIIEAKPENFELIKLMADNGDIKKIMEENPRIIVPRLCVR